MAAGSNSGGFHFEETFGSSLSRHAISFQSSATNSTSDMVPQFGNFYGVNNNNNNAAAGMMLSANSGIINNNNPGTGNSSGPVLLDSVSGLKHDTGLAVEWSVDEQYKLEEGLAKFANVPSIMRYVKIAATLRDKTVRDVALRSRWMTRKRSKHEDYNVGKKVKDRKDKLAESSLMTNMTSASSSTMTPYSLMLHHQGQTERMPSEGLSGTKHLLEQNNQVLGQISANLTTRKMMKLQENINLFSRTRNNITSILNDMRNMPGIMSQMPALPVCIDEELANSVLPTAQKIMFGGGSTSGIHMMKQEPRC